MRQLICYTVATLLAALFWQGDKCVAQTKTNSTVFNIQNEAVTEFLTSGDATFSAQSGTYSQAFFDQPLSYRPDQPAAKELTFSDPKATSAKVYLRNKGNAKNHGFIGEFCLKNGTGKCLLRNLVPDCTYQYEVVANDGRKIASGSFQTTGQVRMIALEKGFNIRDLGGWKGLGGRTVRYEQIYRGGSLGGTDKDANMSDITDADKAELLRIGIRAQLDLRAKTNAGRYAGESSLHSYSAGMTTMLQSDFNNTMTDNGAYNEDATIISDIAWIIYELKNGRPVYFNCRQGADRTGTIAFVIEGLLGCYEYTNAQGGNQMALDYELTGFSQANLVDNAKVSTSCRPASEAYSNKHKLFRQLLDLEAAEPEIRLQNLQQKCYYYLNRYTSPKHQSGTPHIDREDLDWFIAFMLGMSRSEYAPYKQAWAQRGGDLKQIGEAYANAINYYVKPQANEKK